MVKLPQLRNSYYTGWRRKVEIYKLVAKFSKLSTLYEVLYCTSSEYITVTLFKLYAGIEICRNLSQRDPLYLIALWKFQISGKVSHAISFTSLFRIMPYLIILSCRVSGGHTIIFALEWPSNTRITIQLTGNTVALGNIRFQPSWKSIQKLTPQN